MYVCMLRRQMAQFQCEFKRNLVFSGFKGTWLVFFSSISFEKENFIFTTDQNHHFFLQT